MKNIPESVNISIKPEWLKSGYYVYAVIIKHDNKTYLYIGQTGDNYHPKARGPLFRISGHFSKTKSSDQNQIIKGFRNHISVGEDQYDERLEKALMDAEINYYYFEIEQFIFGEDAEHEKKRKKTQFIEHWLLWKLKESDVIIFNDEAKSEISDSNKKFFHEKAKDELLKAAKEILENINTKL